MIEEPQLQVRAVQTWKLSLSSTSASLWAARSPGRAAFSPACSQKASTPCSGTPAHTTTIWKLYENAQGNKFDVVALMTVHGHIAYFATQAPLPPPPKN